MASAEKFDYAARQRMRAQTPETPLRAEHVAECRILPDRLALLDVLPKGGVAAEIGVSKGKFTLEIMTRATPAQLYLIDAWSDVRFAPGLKRVRDRFADELEDGQVKILQGLSTNMLQTLPDALFDWVYIDTNHLFGTTFSELRLCDAKVKPGGMIAGHDFCAGNVVSGVPYGVTQACAKFCVEAGWRFRWLTLDADGHFSFCLERLPA